MKNNTDIDRIASLSGLMIEDEERQELVSEVNRLIDFAAAIAETVSEYTLTEKGNPPKTLTRADTVKDSLDNSLLMRNAPSVSDDGYIRVPSVMREDGRRENE